MDGRNIIIAILASVLVVVILGLSIPLLNDAATTAHLSNRISLIQYALGAAGISPNQVLYSDSNGELAGSSLFTFNGTTLDTPTGRTASYIIADENTPAHIQAQADIVCTGTDDDEIQSAIDSCSGTSYERIIMLGDFTIDNTITGESYVILELYGSITLDDSSDCSMLTVNGKTNMFINGGEWNGNEANQSTGAALMSFDNCDNVTIQNTNMHSCKYSALDDQIIVLEECTHFWIKDNLLHDAERIIGLQGDSSSPYTATQYINIINNNIYDYYQHAISTYNAVNHVEIRGNIIHDGTMSGSALYGIVTSQQASDGRVTDYLTITNNKIYTHNGPNAMDIHGGQGHIIANNEITDITGQGIYCHYTGTNDNVWVGNWNITGNKVDGCTNGISIGSDTANTEVCDVKISNNTVRNYTTHGIVLNASASNSTLRRVDIVGNTISTHTTSAHGNCITTLKGGAASDNCNGYLIANNTLYGYGASADSDYGISVAIPGTVVRGNVLNDFASTCIYTTADDVLIDGNYMRGATYGYASIDGDACIVTNNIIRSCTTPVYLANASCNMTMVSNNNWYSCTNDINSGSATNPRISSNIDKSGAWAWGDNVQ